MRYYLTILSFLLCLSSVAQNIHDVKILSQQDMARWDVPGANYSGIANVGDNSYALVSDKEKTEGYYPFTILLDSVSGKVKDITVSPFVAVAEETPYWAQRDQEGIAFNPYNKTLAISGEADQRVIECSLSGHLTGRELKVPAELGKEAIFPNYGFEALTFSAADSTYWTVTEHTLKADGRKSDGNNPQPCLLRLQSFDADMKPSKQYAYRTEAPVCRKKASNYAFGVPAVTALEDGSLLVLEREFFVSPRHLGSWVQNRIFHVRPATAPPITFSTNLSVLKDEAFLHKKLVAEFSTSLNITARSLANYEGMCLGPRLSDGRHTLILISDSQNNYGNALYKMKDFVKVITFR